MRRTAARAGRMGEIPVFHDRTDAGAVLAGHLHRFRAPGTLVLGIPRGGVAVAAEVASRLAVPLDIVVARKLAAPTSDELAVGAVTANGGVFFDEEIIRQLEVPARYVAAVARQERAVARLQERTLRAGHPGVPVEDRTVLLVDDGLATGATMRATVRSLRRHRPTRIVVAAPVGSTPACARLRAEADEVVCPYELDDFGAVGWYYLDFSPVEDATVRALLETARADALSAAPQPGGTA